MIGVSINIFSMDNKQYYYLSPYVDTSYDSLNNVAQFHQYVFGRNVILRISKKNYLNLLFLLQKGVDGKDLEKFCIENDIKYLDFINGMLGCCVIE